MLHLAGRIAFGVDVGDLLQLQRAFQRDREVDAAAEKQKILSRVTAASRQAPRRSSSCDRIVSSLPGNSQQLLHQASRLASSLIVSRACARYMRQNEQRRQLRRERLGRGDADLRPGMRQSVPAASRVIMEPTTLQIASVFEPFCFASRCAASVSAVSPDCEITTVSVFGVDDRIAVAELAAVIDFDRDARQLLDHELAGQRRVPAGAAGDDLDLT